MAGKASKTDKDAPDAITIKKYANRRLYNTASSSYVTLDDLATMVQRRSRIHCARCQDQRRHHSGRF